MRLLPELPARDIGANLGVARKQRRAAHLLDQVLVDGVGLPEAEGPVDQDRHQAVGVEGQELRLCRVAGGEIERNDLRLQAEMMDDRQDLAAVGRSGKDVELHRPDSSVGSW
jgi:hypothetical protein